MTEMKLKMWYLNVDISSGQQSGITNRCRSMYEHSSLYRSIIPWGFCLLGCVTLRWWLFGEDEKYVWRGEYNVSIKFICLFLLVFFSIECQVVNELERTLFSLSNQTFLFSDARRHSLLLFSAQFSSVYFSHLWRISRCY
jgi:hypothetical protein